MSKLNEKLTLPEVASIAGIQSDTLRMWYRRDYPVSRPAGSQGTGGWLRYSVKEAILVAVYARAVTDHRDHEIAEKVVTAFRGYVAAQADGVEGDGLWLVCYRSEPPKRSESVLQGQPYLYADEIDKEDQAMMCIRELMDGTAHLGKAVSPTVIPLHMIWLEIAGKIANHLNERAEKKS